MTEKATDWTDLRRIAESAHRLDDARGSGRGQSARGTLRPGDGGSGGQLASGFNRLAAALDENRLLRDQVVAERLLVGEGHGCPFDRIAVVFVVHQALADHADVDF